MPTSEHQTSHEQYHALPYSN